MSRKRHLAPNLFVLVALLSISMALAITALLSLTRTPSDFGHILIVYEQAYGSSFADSPYFYDWNTEEQELLPTEPISDSMLSWTVDEGHVFTEACVRPEPLYCNPQVINVLPKDTVQKFDALKSLWINNHNGNLMWSPDGQSMLLRGKQDIQTMNADGSNARDLPQVNLPKGDDFAWSPNGKYLAFIARVNKADQLEMLDLADNQLNSIAFSYLPAVRSHLIWSPDSRQIAILSPPSEKTDVPQVRIMDVNGTNLEEIPNSALYYASQLAWSPDSVRLAMGLGTGIYVFNRDATNLRQLTDIRSAGALAWSPDGGQLAFYGRSGEGVSLYIIDTDGHHLPVRLYEDQIFAGFDVLFPSLFWLR